MLIYVPQITNRLTYTFELLLRDLVGIDYELTIDPDRFAFHTGPKMNYSRQPFADELFMYSTDLLFEKKIRRQDLSVFDWNDTKAFFATHPKYIIPFDPFAASFYLVSRYEEYFPYTSDKYARFDASESLAHQKGFLNKPLVNIFAKKIREIISNEYPAQTFRRKKYNYISTIDIDNAWAYKEKGILRTTGALVRSLTSLQMKNLAERVSVLTGRKPDPYDTYDHIFRIQAKYNLKMIFFFLLGNYDRNDKNVSYSNRNFQALIKQISDYFEIGIHPSFASNDKPQLLRTEQKRLKKITHRDITKSRQHFLKLSFPSTYRNLIDNDITDDYTMGYAGEIGFRAGICTPFYFYDLERELETHLRIHPFAVMDATLKYYMKVQPAEVMSYVGPIIREIKSVDGNFTTIWHNESLSDRDQWQGWIGVYEDIVKSAVS
jgi:peptidoglycan/xylan/chitin deacetylase (PgdA/CDA1 family)